MKKSVITAWHGTNQTFETFDGGKLGSHTASASSWGAFFFAMREDTAAEYAYAAARKLIPEQDEHDRAVAHLLALADVEESLRNWDKADALRMEAENLDIAAIQAPPRNAMLLKVEIDVTPGLAAFITMDLEGGYLNTQTLLDHLERATVAGSPGVVIKNVLDTPTNGCEPDDHIAVFDSTRIQILERVVLQSRQLDPAMADADSADRSPDI